MFLESLLLMLKLVHLIKSKKITINYVDVICLETRGGDENGFQVKSSFS